MKSYAFGIDLGGTTVKIGLFDPQGTILEKWEIPTDKSNNGANVLSDIAASVLGKMKEKGIGADQVEGVGIDVPGPVLNETVVNRCVNIGWGVIDVGKELLVVHQNGYRFSRDIPVSYPESEALRSGLLVPGSEESRVLDEVRVRIGVHPDVRSDEDMASLALGLQI